MAKRRGHKVGKKRGHRGKGKLVPAKMHGKSMRKRGRKRA